MSHKRQSRRQFFGASAGVSATVAAVLADPPDAAEQSTGVKKADLPDLSTLDLPLHVGEFLTSISGFAEYIRHGALDVVWSARQILKIGFGFQCPFSAVALH